MDGLSTLFLRETPFFSGSADQVGGGILYFEDFESDAVTTEQLAEHRDEPLPPAPTLTQEDLDAARQAGREEGLQLALADARLLQAELHAAALQSLVDALTAARQSLERTARQVAEDGVRAMLAVVRAAVPACMSRHAACETDAVIDALLPGLVCEPELRVRTHPDLADHVRESLAGSLPSDGLVLSVAADPQLMLGDVQIAWRDGGARRDCAAIWNDITAALAPLDLPSLEEICHGRGQ